MFWSSFLTVFIILLMVSSVVVIVFDDASPAAKLAWILAIILLPIVGMVLYLLFGINNRYHYIFKRRHRRYTKLLEAETSPELKTLLGSHTKDELVREEFRPLARMLGTGFHPCVSDDNAFEIITEGKRKYELLLEDLRGARESIHIEYFRFGTDSGSEDVRNILIQKAKEGVKVRFINENIVNFSLFPGYYGRMRRAGIEVLKFTDPRRHLLELPTRLNYRNHRKIVVIDGRIGYTGGMNINNNYFLFWRDTHLRLTGNAVAALQFIFLDSWIVGGGKLDHPLPHFYPMLQGSTMEKDAPLTGKLVQVVQDEPDGGQPVLQMSYEWVLLNARKYIWLQTPYFAPPVAVLSALKAAALSGVDVRLMIPEKNDTIFMGSINKSYYRQCLEAGIRIFERGGNFIHSKTFVCDDYLSSIGSANIDNRSFNLNYEVNTYIYDEETALRNKAIFEEDLALCREITLQEILDTPRYKRFCRKLVGLFSSLT